MSTKKKDNKEVEFAVVMDDSNMMSAREYEQYVKEHPEIEKIADEAVRNLD